jgi:alkanesulfonate monooxygenase
MPESASAARVFGTLPSSTDVEGDYLQAVADVSRWCEAGGCTGVLIYTDNSLVDPWLVAQEVIRETRELCPLVAVQPVYMHPYAVAKLVASLAELHGRRVYLNLVAGGFVNDLLALGDETEHDRRYDRLVEYTSIIQRLLADEGPVTHEGDWYQVANLTLRPRVPDRLRPGYLVSGSSPAGMLAARTLGATAVQYPRPAAEYLATFDGAQAEDKGIRIGILAREDADEAWRVAWERFPGDQRGRLMHRLAMATSDSMWHEQLSGLGRASDSERPTYWLHPFENYKTFCPYLVGSYESVAEMVAGYLASGFATFILDVPFEADDLKHTQVVFDLAGARAAAA